jgi:hypothetical protein
MDFFLFNCDSFLSFLRGGGGRAGAVLCAAL